MVKGLCVYQRIIRKNGNINQIVSILNYFILTTSLGIMKFINVEIIKDKVLKGSDTLCIIPDN